MSIKQALLPCDEVVNFVAQEARRLLMSDHPFLKLQENSEDYCPIDPVEFVRIVLNEVLRDDNKEGPENYLLRKGFSAESASLLAIKTYNALASEIGSMLPATEFGNNDSLEADVCGPNNDIVLTAVKY